MKLLATSTFTLLTAITFTLLFTATPTSALCCRDNESGQCNNINASECPVNSSFADNCCGPPPSPSGAAAETTIAQAGREVGAGEGEEKGEGQE